MGQQQLLLLVLGIVIVGLAVVAGINAFEQNQKKSSQDAMVQEAFRMATDAKSWYLKPSEFGGGGGDASSLGSMTYADLDVDAASGGSYNTPWGDIELDASGSTAEFNLVRTGENTGFGCVTLDPSATEEIAFAENACS